MSTPSCVIVHRLRILLILIGTIVGMQLLVESPARAQDAVAEIEPGWCVKGKYKDGGRPTDDALTKIFTDHAAWRKDPEARAQQRANLCGADLHGARLTGLDLSGAKLAAASLMNADLGAADLTASDMSFASLRAANLAHAHLVGTNLTAADLSNADLTGADLTGTSLPRANLAFTIFEPKPGALPKIPDLALAKNLFQMTFNVSPHALVALRDAFKKHGMRQQEREITYALKHTERLRRWRGGGLTGKIESAFNFVLFELTSRYGMSPGRPLWIVGVLTLLFSIPYMMALQSGGRSGIWAIRPPDSVHKGRKGSKPVWVTVNFASGASVGQFVLCWLRVIRVGIYFSLLSTFRIGWRDLNLGNWISRIQSREYILRATGWVRTVSGIQSLISVYLFALWVVTYFGRPFE